MNEVATIEHSQTARDIRAQVNLIQEVMKEVMQNGQHYGVVPGCGNKPTLLKPGAEKLMMTFRLAVDPEVEDLGTSDVRRYRVRTRVTAQSTGIFLGMGVGECSSDEEKYSWREAVCQEEFNAADPCNKREKWKKGLKAPLLQVHTNPADVANTILKMAKKRSLVDAILTVTGASDIFTQDIEDMPDELRGNGTPPKEAKPSVNEMCVPNYGPDAGQPFSQVSTEHLHDYLAGAERSINDEKKARFKGKNIEMRDALKAEIAKREAVTTDPAPETRQQEDGLDRKEDKVGPQQGQDAPAAPNVQDYLTKVKLSESVRECSTVGNEAEASNLSDEDRKVVRKAVSDKMRELQKK